MIITLELTAKELEKFEEAVLYYQDEGPAPNGWCSVLKERVEAKVQAAIREAKR